MTTTPRPGPGRDKSLDPISDDRVAVDRRTGPDDGPSTQPDEIESQDVVEAENSRPTLPGETADGLDDMDEEIRHQAEDQPLDTPGRLR